MSAPAPKRERAPASEITKKFNEEVFLLPLQTCFPISDLAPSWDRAFLCRRLLRRRMKRITSESRFGGASIHFFIRLHISAARVCSSARSFCSSTPCSVQSSPRTCGGGPSFRTWAERFGRRGTEPKELFTSEFGQNSCKIQEYSIFVRKKNHRKSKFQHFLKYW